MTAVSANLKDKYVAYVDAAQQNQSHTLSFELIWFEASAAGTVQFNKTETW